MEEILYLEVPTPDTGTVCNWLQEKFDPGAGEKILTPGGFRLRIPREEKAPQITAISTVAISDSVGNEPETAPTGPEFSVFVWSLQRTTYLKAFGLNLPAPLGKKLTQQLTEAIRQQFPHQYPAPPDIDLSQQSIFQALQPHYPQTVKYFQKIPNGEADLQRVYWWEKRWREGVKNPQAPHPVIFKQLESTTDPGTPPEYDLIYVGGALGVIHAAAMARLGYRVLLIERLPFGRMNREWNISREELQGLIELGLFTASEVEELIAREYQDGFNKFFDAYNPPYAQAAILHTPTVLNIALNSDKLLQACGEKLRGAGGEIWDETDFLQADIHTHQVIVHTCHRRTQTENQATGRLLVDAMGTASPIAWQLNGGRAFDSVCPTVGAVINGGFAPGVWDSKFGDVLHSHGDISRGRQLIWELFPGAGDDLTIYLFHYHQIHPDNPGSLLEMYEDFFTILPEYRRCDLEQLSWKKATFGYIPGHFSQSGGDRKIAFDRLIAIGDAAALQSPLVFTGFGSLVRNLPRLTELLNTALKHDLLTANHLNSIRAYQSNVSVTWLFSKGMMVPTGRFLPPQRINSILNTFFGILADEPPEIANTFIKDRTSWWMFTGLALKAAVKNPLLLWWILDFVSFAEVWRWLGSYFYFTWVSLISFILGWLPRVGRSLQPQIESQYPAIWLWLLTTSYAITSGLGKRPGKLIINN